jgi:hypothetical protein
VKIVSGDADPDHMNMILVRAKKIFGEALEFAIDYGEKP